VLVAVVMAVFVRFPTLLTEVQTWVVVVVVVEILETVQETVAQVL